jgi:pyrroline-5-carboxylate reductase
MNPVTAVSGSGPAYFFLLIDAIIEAATSLGIEKNTAEKLVVQTALGAAVLKMHTGLPASALIERITSKKGTTAAAFSIFEKHNLRNIIIKAVKQAAQRAEALSK